MARLKAGQTPEPLTERMKRYHTELRQEGGHRLIADLDKQAHDSLKTIQARDGSTIKVAVSAALNHFAGLKGRRAKS